jgi:hypothetical protein
MKKHEHALYFLTKGLPMRENRYQYNLINTLRTMFPGCIILKNDANYLQGIPDLTIFFRDRWAMLEVKASASSPSGPNQDYYIDVLNGMSFASYIYPENEKDVLNELQRSFRYSGATRFSER